MDFSAPQELATSDSLEELTRRMVLAAQELGFGLASGVVVQGKLGSSPVRSWGNPPAGYAEASRSLPDGLRDPVLNRLLRGPGWISYDQQTYVQHGAPDLWDCQAAYGYRFGIAVALHDPAHGRAVLVGMDRPDALPTGSELVRLRASLQLIALQCQAALDRIEGQREDAAELLRAELDALRRVGHEFALRGGLVEMRRDDAVSVFHAMQKLRSSNPLGAVLRAIDSGQLPDLE